MPTNHAYTLWLEIRNSKCAIYLHAIEANDDFAVDVKYRYAHLTRLVHCLLGESTVFVDIFFGVFDALLVKVLLRCVAITTPWSAVDCYVLCHMIAPFFTILSIAHMHCLCKLNVTLFTGATKAVTMPSGMRQSPTDTPTPDERRSSNAAVVILLEMADLSWRIFVPTLSLLLLGHWLDTKIGSSPWLMFVGVAIGSLGAWLLIKTQLNRGTNN